MIKYRFNKKSNKDQKNTQSLSNRFLLTKPNEVNMQIVITSVLFDQNMLSLNVTDAVYNANTAEFLGSKNISLTPIELQSNIILMKGS